MGMKAVTTASGSAMIGSNALRRCSRKRMITSATTIISSVRALFSVSIARSMRCFAVVNRHDLPPSGSVGRSSSSLRSTRPITSSVLAVAHDDDAGHRLALAVEVGGAAPNVAAHRYVADVANQHGVPPFRSNDDVLDVLDAREVAATTNEYSRSDISGAREPDVVVGAPHSLNHVRD